MKSMKCLGVLASLVLTPVFLIAGETWGLVDAMCVNNATTQWPFHSDEGFYANNGMVLAHDPTVDALTKGADDWAPDSVYKAERFITAMSSSGWLQVTFPNLIPGAAYKVCYLGAEVYYDAIGKRVFRLEINGVTAEPAFDLFAETGGKFIACTRYYETTADANGQVVLRFTKGSADNCKYGGLAIFSQNAPQNLVLNAENHSGTTKNTLVYSAKNALSYVLQRADAEAGPWSDIVPETLTKCGERRAFEDTVPSVDSCAWYRLIASNGVSVVTGAVVKVDKNVKTQVVYAFNCGGDEAVYGRFAPADWMDASIVPYARALGPIAFSRLSTEVPQGVFASVYRSKRLVFTLPNLKTDKTYLLRLYSADDASSAAGARVMRVLVNDEEMVAGWDVFADVGASNACERDVNGLTPDVSGQLKLEVEGTAGLAQLCAFELIEQGSDEIPLVPTVKGVYSVGRGATVVIGQSSAEVAYAVRRKRAGTAVYETLTEAARLGWHDRAAEVGSAYSVRAKNVSGLWSDWSEDVVLAAPSDASPRKWIGMGRDGATVTGKFGTYMEYVRPTGDTENLNGIDCNNWPAARDFTTQIDPIPEKLRRYIYWTRNSADFGGFNAVLTNLVPNALYRVRITTTDNVSGSPNQRLLDFYVNSKKIVADLDIYRMFTQSRVASYETLARATPSGIIFAEVRSTVENPQLHAVEAWLQEGGNADGGETCVTADSKSVGGFIFAPDTDTYTFEADGSAKCSLFIDDKPVFRRGTVSALPVSGAVTLSQGAHRYRLIVVGSDVEVPAVTWRSSSLAKQDVSSFLSYESENTQAIGGDYRVREFGTLGLGGDAYRLGIGGAGSDVWRLVASGSEVNGTSENAMGVVADMRHGGEMTMRVLNLRECANNAQVGILAQNATPPFNAASYFLGIGATHVDFSVLSKSCDFKAQPIVGTIDDGKVKAIASQSATSTGLPIWLKLNETGGVNGMATISYSRDGSSWTELCSVSSSKIPNGKKLLGAFIVGCSDTQCAIAEVDNVTLTRNPSPGVLLIVR